MPDTEWTSTDERRDLDALDGEIELDETDSFDGVDESEQGAFDEGAHYGAPRSLDDAFAVMESADAAAAAALRSRWGEDAEDNLRFAQAGVEAIATPELIRSLEAAGLADHPDIAEAAAKIGRQLARPAGNADPVNFGTAGLAGRDPEALGKQHAALTGAIADALSRGDRAEAGRLSRRRRSIAGLLVAAREKPKTVRSSGSTGADDALGDEHAQITHLINDALDRGDRAKAQALSQRRMDISRRLVGTTPIVGGGGRSI